MLDNLDFDLLREGLFVLMRDKYSMPSEYAAYRDKALRIHELYGKVLEMQGSLAEIPR